MEASNVETQCEDLGVDIEPRSNSDCGDISDTVLSQCASLSPPSTPTRLMSVMHAPHANEGARIAPPDSLDMSIAAEASPAYNIQRIRPKQISLATTRPSLSGLTAADAMLSPIGGRGLLAPAHILTPPDESEHSSWLTPGTGAPLAGSAAQPRVGSSTSSEVDPSDFNPPIAHPLRGVVLATGAASEQLWLERVLQAIDLERKHPRILSVASPSPERHGHVLYRLLDQVAQQRPSLQQITVFHAVPRGYHLARLPFSAAQSSPLNDHLSSKVISTAVPSPQPSCNPSAAHGSIHLSIVERLIPPSSEVEVREWLDSDPDHFLAQRLNELTSKNGVMVLIHPTYEGARTFASKCLGALLDPILRSMTVRYDLTTNFSESIGNAGSLQAIPTYQDLLQTIKQLCDKVNRLNPSNAGAQNTTRVHHQLVYAAQVHEVIAPDVWASWWAEQEKHRIEDVVRQYFRTTTREPKQYTSKPEMQVELPPQAMMVNEVVFDLGAKAREAGPTAKIELGVFVIKKTQILEDQAKTG